MHFGIHTSYILSSFGFVLGGMLLLLWSSIRQANRIKKTLLTKDDLP